MKIYISPSVQEYNIGFGGYGTEEKQMNLIADVVVELLQFNHLEVYRNRPEMTLHEVVADSNARGCEVHFAIHSNAGGGTGCEIYYTSEKGKILASAVYKYMEPLTPMKDRGIKHQDHFYELNETVAIASLVEVAFHDNSTDAEFIMNYIKEIAEAIAHGICEYCGIDFKKPEPVKPTGKIYRVQVGYYTIRAYAEAKLAELKAKGFDGFIKED